MRIIAIDPGYERLGISILEKDSSGKITYLYSECFHTSKTLTHPKRLALIAGKIKKIIDTWQPKALAIESLFLTTNHKTVMFVAEARGVILSECARQNLDIFEYSPPQIKSAVGGSGKADKKSIIKMLPFLIKIPKTIKIDDEFDAIAVGLTCFAIEKWS